MCHYPHNKNYSSSIHYRSTQSKGAYYLERTNQGHKQNFLRHPPLLVSRCICRALEIQNQSECRTKTTRSLRVTLIKQNKFYQNWLKRDQMYLQKFINVEISNKLHPHQPGDDGVHDIRISPCRLSRSISGVRGGKYN